MPYSQLAQTERNPHFQRVSCCSWIHFFRDQAHEVRNSLLRKNIMPLSVPVSNHHTMLQAIVVEGIHGSFETCLLFLD
eukprot:333996-Pelagomonas_calceolata.AAC.11